MCCFMQAAQLLCCGIYDAHLIVVYLFQSNKILGPICFGVGKDYSFKEIHRHSFSTCLHSSGHPSKVLFPKEMMGTHGELCWYGYVI